MWTIARRGWPGAVAVLAVAVTAMSAAATEIKLTPCHECTATAQRDVIQTAISDYDVVSLGPGEYFLAGEDGVALTIGKRVILRGEKPLEKAHLIVAEGAPFAIDAPGEAVRIENVAWSAPSPGRIARAAQVWIRGCEPAAAAEGRTSLLVEGVADDPHSIGELHIEDCALSGVPPLGMFRLRGTRAFIIGNDFTATGYSHNGVVAMGIDIDNIDPASTLLLEHNWIRLALPTPPWRGDGVDYAPSVLAFLNCLINSGYPEQCVPNDPVSQWGACFLVNGTGAGCIGIDQIVVGVMIGNAMIDPVGQPTVWNVSIDDLAIDVTWPGRLNQAVSLGFCHSCTLRNVRHPATEAYDFSSLADLNLLSTVIGGPWNYPWLAEMDIVDADYLLMQSEASTLIDNASGACRVYDTSDTDNFDDVYDGDNLLLGRLSQICGVAAGR